jgi:hypothetical protein
MERKNRKASTGNPSSSSSSFCWSYLDQEVAATAPTFQEADQEALVASHGGYSSAAVAEVEVVAAVGQAEAAVVVDLADSAEEVVVEEERVEVGN